MKTRRRVALTGVLVTTIAMLVGYAPSAGASTGNSSPVKLGIIAAETGPLSPGISSALAAAKARVDLANATGGENGHRIQLIIVDDQSTAQGALTAAQSLVAQGVVGVAWCTPEVEGTASEYLDAQGIAAASTTSDPLMVADKNAFSVDGSGGPSVPANTGLGVFAKSKGLTKLAGVGWGNVAVAVDLLQAPLKAAQTIGVHTVLTDLSPTTTTTDFTSDALKVKQSGAQSLYTVMGVQDNVALAVALQQQGVHLKAEVYGAATYEKSILSDPNESALEGTYAQNWFAPFSLDTPAVETYRATLQKYAPGAFGGLYESWLYVAMDLLIHGVGNVHGAVTAASVIKGLSSISHYTGAGLLPQALNYTISKTAPSNVQKCFWYPEVLHKQFVVTDQNPICGKLVS